MAKRSFFGIRPFLKTVPDVHKVHVPDSLAQLLVHVDLVDVLLDVVPDHEGEDDRDDQEEGQQPGEQRIGKVQEVVSFM